MYVSDGYCNARVAQFTSEGEHVTDFMLVEGTMNVPHSLVLHECSDRLSVADRENAKVHQFELSTRKHTGMSPRVWERTLFQETQVHPFL